MTAAPPPASGTALASWGARLGAYIIDILPIVILFVVLTAAFGDNETTSTSFSFQLNGLPALAYFVLTIGWLVVNWGLPQGRRGVGPSIARQVLHVVDALPCYLGFLWPLWDKENRTFADMIMETRVVKR